MTSREWFEVAVRVIGAVTLFWGVGYLVESALFYTEYIQNPDVGFRYYLIYGWINIFVSLLLMRAPWILVNFAYPPVTDEEARESEKDAT